MKNIQKQIKDREMIPVLVLFKQVGDFILGDSIKEYLDRFEFSIDDMSDDKVTPVICYTFSNPEITLFVEIDGIIDYIECYEELLYKGVNLIGLSVQQFSNHVEDDYSDEDRLYVNEEDVRYVYEFNQVGLQVWAKGKLGVIDSVVVYRKEHYAD
ncbi:hypothetical protein FAZ19_09760 [Sphingobacterium alkalisoli]|uniref:Uncharacterized protein n=1 Tax=Sphingobacterium alkalisoli TaxID=1874115 RepID=A0A4U0H1H9_9SPHI|nr:hypothetical protein [Sphingobacterium alkalisoli]TJY65425.1 hypothetical protein FAZ19_09760 [Sphingobacterium alkalisoli]